MLILLAADVHYRLPALDWLCDAAESFDVVVLAGDLLDTASDVPLSAQIMVVESYLRRLASATPVMVISGNHDLDGPGAHGEQVSSWLQRVKSDQLYTDGDTVDLDSVRFTLCPWWDGPITRQLVDDQLRADAVDRPETWIWVYHSPPAGTPLCRDGSRTFPDNDVARWIEELHPDLVLSGHIHHAPWAVGGSWHAKLAGASVFNPGHVAASVPPHIVIDTTLGVARWQGVSGEPTVQIAI